MQEKKGEAPAETSQAGYPRQTVHRLSLRQNASCRLGLVLKLATSLPTLPGLSPYGKLQAWTRPRLPPPNILTISSTTAAPMKATIISLMIG